MGKSSDKKSIEMWKATDKKNISVLCEYYPEQFRFKVIVSYKDTKYFQFFKANFEPHFGMDVTDLQESQQIAEFLALKIEKELNI